MFQSFHVHLCDRKERNQLVVKVTFQSTNQVYGTLSLCLWYLSESCPAKKDPQRTPRK